LEHCAIWVEDVDPFVLLAYLPEQGVEFCRLRDIGRDRDAIRAELFLSITDGLRTAPNHDHLGALLNEPSCGCEADTARAAGR